MRISSVNKFCFKANIIDAHVHRGSENCKWNGVKFPTEKLDEFIKEPLTISIAGQEQTDNVTKVLVSSIDGLALDNNQREELNRKGLPKTSLKPEEIIFAKNEIEANMDMINKYKNDKFYAVMAVCQPTKTNGSAQNIKKLITTNPNTIFGLKFHPQDLLLNADSPLYDSYLKLAKKHKLPCLFHSQVSVNYEATPIVRKDIKNWSDPHYIYNLAKRHPDVPIIMGHMGAGSNLGHDDAINILKQSIKNKDAKLYVDISWVNFDKDLPAEHPKSIIKVINELKELNALDRILFGTDAPLGCYGEPNKLEQTKMSPKQAYELTISRIKTCIKRQYGEEAESIINKIFYENADELFFKKSWANSTPNTKITKTTKVVAGTALGVGTLSLIINTLLRKNSTTQKELIIHHPQAHPHHTKAYSNLK